MNSRPSINFAFFGTSRFSVLVLDGLEKAGLMPALIVTTPDRERGRGLELQPTPVKEWAQKRNIEVMDPTALDAGFTQALQKQVTDKKIAVFIVVSYGKIMPKAIIDMPSRRTLNVHASLLPKYRGASPLQSAMLDDAQDTGISIIRLDEKMDHGPVIADKAIRMEAWPTYESYEALMAHEGALLLASALPEWVSGNIQEREQDHSQATFAKKIVKEDGQIDLADISADAPSGDAYKAFRKIQAYHQWPTAYFFIEKKDAKSGETRKLRVKITQASFKNGKLTIEKVIPEGSREMAYGDFLKGIGSANQ